MKNFFIVGIVLFCFTSACAPVQKGIEEMPTMQVSVDGNFFDTATGSYCWSSKNSSECADASGDPFDYVDDTPLIVVQPGKEIELRFSEDPDSFMINVYGNDQVFTSIEGNPFGAPLEEGIYGYNVSTQWGKDHIEFYFVLDVQ